MMPSLQPGRRGGSQDGRAALLQGRASRKHPQVAFPNHRSVGGPISRMGPTRFRGMSLPREWLSQRHAPGPPGPPPRLWLSRCPDGETQGSEQEGQGCACDQSPAHCPDSTVGPLPPASPRRGGCPGAIIPANLQCVSATFLSSPTLSEGCTGTAAPPLSREASGFLPWLPPPSHMHVPSPITGRRDFYEKDTVESQRTWLMSPAVPRGPGKDRGGGLPLRGICGCAEGPGDRERGELFHAGQGRAGSPCSSSFRSLPVWSPRGPGAGPSAKKEQKRRAEALARRLCSPPPQPRSSHLESGDEEEEGRWACAPTLCMTSSRRIRNLCSDVVIWVPVESVSASNTRP